MFINLFEFLQMIRQINSSVTIVGPCEQSVQPRSIINIESKPERHHNSYRDADQRLLRGFKHFASAVHVVFWSRDCDYAHIRSFGWNIHSSLRLLTNLTTTPRHQRSKTGESTTLRHVRKKHNVGDATKRLEYR